ncbi:MAG: DNA helicase RecQ [Lewinellaceae bacterium]|nr:DNA helicase RecQ [Phaeodactylibacter sp.]MCB9350864.1 DNA helicase RecQ [Lewinellaceae bacterium]
MTLSTAKEALKKYFGYDTFRPMQAEIIERIGQGKDALVLMPTGGGKSACYQIPAITLPGTAVVVSPLISLMKDQVEGLVATGARAAYLNSSLDDVEQRRVEDQFFNGELDLLYVSPEKLVSQNFIPLLKRATVNLFAIDEAHCISSWGHDFRPEYTQMRFLKGEFKDIPVIALTATADKLTRKDIINQLHLKEPKTFIASFDRPNLSLEVRPGQKRREQIIRFIQKRPKQPGIIYCLSRRSTEELAEKLRDAGIDAAHYHAGMNADERSKVQEDFINDNTLVICATVAFGMGIDKSNVRWVIHYNLPKNIESYYQEIGRAGRDGAAADTLLFYSYQDVMMLEDILKKNESDMLDVKIAKLDRMRQYAEAVGCRRRILLSYFSEDVQQDCGNCDICKNPPKAFDGSVIAQKALSAIYRLRQNVGMSTVIDVLRGSGKKEILERGYHNLKTYGAGSDIPFLEWQHYLLQLLNYGYIEIAHDQHGAVKLTPASQRVLFENENVQLVRFATIKERQEAEKARAKQTAKPQRVRDELFEKLRQLRKHLAQERGVPPYIVFNDATLEEMAAVRPMTDEEMKNINGVGERKLQLYGSYFIDAIIEYVGPSSSHGKASTYQVTYEMYQRGLSVEEIARKRQINLSTIYSHLAILYEQGYDITLEEMVSPAEVDKVLKSLRYLQEPYKLKDIFDYLGEQVPYHRIRLALAYGKREETRG